MGIPWDGMVWYRHNLLWDGMGWDRKICPMDKPADISVTLNKIGPCLMEMYQLNEAFQS